MSIRRRIAMAKIISIQISKTKKIKSLSVVFPKKCVNCGKPPVMTHEFEVKQWLKPETSQSSIETMQVPLYIPYCGEHGEELQHIRDRLQKVFHRVWGITWLVILAPLFIFLYNPVYQWGIQSEIALEKFGSFAPVFIFVFTVIAIGGVVGSLLSILVGVIARWIASLILPNPAGFRISSTLGIVFLHFTNETIAEEFEHINSSQLGIDK
jgi:hypothetical protein